MNDWTEIVIRINTKDVDTVSAIAQMCVSGGIYIEDYSDFEMDIKQFGPVEVIDKDLLEKAKDKEHAAVHVYISPEDNPAEALAFLEERMKSEKIAYTADEGTVREEDWANNWKQYFKPLPIGEKLIIVPTWDDNIPDDCKDRIPLIIDPGMAFGSGQHETTKLCLENVEECVRPDDTVLDVGTGSGILAIGALLLGAKEAVGIDIDKLAVKISAENASLNRVEDRYTAKHGDLATGVKGKFRIVCANIVADIILRLLPDVGDHLTDDGDLILSGIIDERLDEVKETLTKLGYKVVGIRSDRGWNSIRAVKNI